MSMDKGLSTLARRSKGYRGAETARLEVGQATTILLYASVLLSQDLYAVVGPKASGLSSLPRGYWQHIQALADMITSR